MSNTEGQARQEPDQAGSKSWKEWLQKICSVLVQTVKDLVTDHLPQWSAAISYYCLLSAFPLLLAAVSLAANFVDSDWAISQATDALATVMPEGDDMIAEIVQGAIDASGTISVISIAAWLWSGSRVFGVLTIALNIAYDVDESYGFFKRLVVELLMTLSVGLLFVLALCSSFFLDFFSDAVQFLPAQRGLVLDIATFLVPTLLMLLAYFFVYWLIPRDRRFWKSALIGATAATALFLIARPLFYLYLQRFAEFNLIYGSIGLVIVLMIWAWLVALITLFGGELASHVQMMIFEGRSAEEVGQRHNHRAPDKKDADESGNPETT